MEARSSSSDDGRGSRCVGGCGGAGWLRTLVGPSQTGRNGRRRPLRRLALGGLVLAGSSGYLAAWRLMRHTVSFVGTQLPQQRSPSAAVAERPLLACFAVPPADRLLELKADEEHLDSAMRKAALEQHAAFQERTKLQAKADALMMEMGYTRMQQRIGDLRREQEEARQQRAVLQRELEGVLQEKEATRRHLSEALKADLLQAFDAWNSGAKKDESPEIEEKARRLTTHCTPRESRDWFGGEIAASQLLYPLEAVGTSGTVAYFDSDIVIAFETAAGKSRVLLYAQPGGDLTRASERRFALPPNDRLAELKAEEERLEQQMRGLALRQHDVFAERRKLEGEAEGIMAETTYGALQAQIAELASMQEANRQRRSEMQRTLDQVMQEKQTTRQRLRVDLKVELFEAIRAWSGDPKGLLLGKGVNDVIESKARCLISHCSPRGDVATFGVDSSAAAASAPQDWQIVYPESSVVTDGEVAYLDEDIRVEFLTNGGLRVLAPA
eukprot:TRINITY_DN28493_c0_g1_i1.p1 TRINITY_DN28493_c0_g1~~TRINITY_DN28493_c0_g1_i1.p1  ORF type:complete len:516 (+),score=150.60 TRINITY_DN28493_c0_g1_i1:55-1548(+)